MVKSINFIIKAIIFLGLLLLPIFYLPNSVIPYEIPKVMFVYLWGSGLSVCLLIGGFLSGDLKKTGLIQVLAIIWLLVVLLTSFLGVNFEKSLLGNYYRWDGVLTLFVLISIFISLSLTDKKIWLDVAIKGMAWGNILSALWAIGQMALNRGIGFTGFGAGFGQPVFLTGYLLVTTPFVWLEIRKIRNLKVRNRFFLLALLLTVGGLLATKSLLAIAMILIAILGILIIEKQRIWKVLAIVTLTVIFGVGIGYQNEMIKGQEKGGIVYEGRERILMKAYLAFKEKPFFGWGLTNFDRAFEAENWPIKIDKDVYVDKPHSNLAEVIVSSGLLGLLAYLMFLGVVVSNLVKRKDVQSKCLLLVLIMYLIHSQTNIVSINEELVFWLVAAGSVIG